MDVDIEVLQQSFRRLTPKADTLASTFYDLLFERSPEALQLFAGVRFDEQKKKLLRALALVVRNIERQEFLAPYLSGLGAMHVAYGVRPEHYPMVGECLMTALAETAGKSWTPDQEAAWRGAFAVISRVMLSGAARVT